MNSCCEQLKDTEEQDDVRLCYKLGLAAAMDVALKAQQTPHQEHHLLPAADTTMSDHSAMHYGFKSVNQSINPSFLPSFSSFQVQVVGTVVRTASLLL